MTIKNTFKFLMTNIPIFSLYFPVVSSILGHFLQNNVYEGVKA